MTAGSTAPGIPDPGRLQAWLAGNLGSDLAGSPGGEPVGLGEVDLTAGGG